MATYTDSWNTGTIPLTEIATAVAAELGYQDTINGVANPETKATFAHRMIGQLVANMVYHQRDLAAKSAAAAVPVIFT